MHVLDEVEDKGHVTREARSESYLCHSERVVLCEPDLLEAFHYVPLPPDPGWVLLYQQVTERDALVLQFLALVGRDITVGRDLSLETQRHKKK